MRRLMCCLLVLSACRAPLEGLDGPRVMFAPHTVEKGTFSFYDAPYPDDLRLAPTGGPSLGDLPGVPTEGLIAGIAETADDARGYPVSPVAWFRLEATPPRLRPGRAQPITPEAPLQLVDIDPDSPERGRRLPVVARDLAPDRWVARDVIAVAPVPGIVLRPDTTYAFLVRRDLGTADGTRLGVAATFRRLLHGELPDPSWAEPWLDAWAPLRDALPELGLEPDDLAAAAVFTTGDVVADLHDLSERVRAAHTLGIEDLALVDADRPGYCELHGTLEVPEHQRGTPPFPSEGLFAFDEDGDPVVQAWTRIPVVITVPKVPMPAEGYPLALYFHGSGGLSDQLVARGPRPPGGEAEDGYGPAFVLARQGIGAAGSAHPVNPERVPGASAIAYLNFQNLAAFRDTFRQGALEQRLYLDALLDLRLEPELLEGCEGVALPEGSDAYRYDPDRVVAMGQSMGGMYTNIIGAIEPRIRAVVPTGAGGHWSRFILVTELLGEGVPEDLLAGLLDVPKPLTWLHPALHLAQTGWEPAEPMVYTPRLARRPLPGHPVRPIYQPIGRGDSYFPPEVFDAITLGYGNEQAGEVVWPELQEQLALVGRDGLVDYPVADNLVSEDGTPYTGVAVQYAGDGFSDPHIIFTQLDEVKHQYGCFFSTFLEDGVARVPEGGGLDDPCP